MLKASRVAQLRRRIRILLLIFMFGLVASGLTAFPLQQELNLAARALGASETAEGTEGGGLFNWIVMVRNGLRQTYAKYPFVGYGTDWLAFAHLVIAIAFIGPWRDPVQNRWVIDWGIIACALVVPLALICGPFRGIPFYWRLIDCSFGVAGVVPLLLVRKWIRELEQR